MDYTIIIFKSHFDQEKYSIVVTIIIRTLFSYKCPLRKCLKKQKTFFLDFDLALFSYFLYIALPKLCLFPVPVFEYDFLYLICFHRHSLVKPLICTCIFPSAVYITYCYKHKHNYADYVISYERSCITLLSFVYVYV